MRVLFLAHDYPPVGGGGVQRALHFVRALNDAGHDVSVVAVDKDPGALRDPALSARHPPNVPVTRYHLPTVQPVVDVFRGARMSRLPSLFLPTDLYVDSSVFHRATARAALEVAGSFRPDIVVATGPPFGLFEAARAVAAERGAGLVLDMRDPWVESLSGRHPSPIAAGWARNLQRRSVAAADLILVTAPTAQALLERLEVGRPRRVVTITNGFDGGVLMDAATVEKGRKLVRAEGVRTVAFLGRLFTVRSGPPSLLGSLANKVFDRIAIGRDPLRTGDYHTGSWFDALAILAERRKDLRRKLRTVFVGDLPAEAKGFERVTDAFEVVRHGYQPYSVASAAMREADGLLLPNVSTSDDSPSFIIPGKMFEYLAAGPPIFAMFGPGDCADIIRETGAGIWVHDRHPGQMADHLERWLDGRPLPLARDEAAIAKYERTRLGRRFVDELERVHAERAAGNQARRSS